MKRTLRKSEIKELNEKIANFNFEISKKDKVEEFDEELILINDEPSFFYYEDMLIPTLKLLLKNMILKKVVVDMGAVKFMTSGADVMRPGITEIDDSIEKGDVVAVVEEKHGKPLTVGISMFSGPEMKELSSGKVIKSVHYVGDRIWVI